MSSAQPHESASPSPLWSRFTDSSRESTPDSNTPSKPLSGPGTSRQSRRLQLRNAGFRGAAMPSRKVTPGKSTSETMTDASGSQQKGRESREGAENSVPSGLPRVPSGNLGLGGLQVEKSRRRVSGGILQEIGSGSVTGRQSVGRKARPRVSTSKFLGQESIAPRNDYDSAFTAHENIMSSPPPSGSAKLSIKSKKTKARARIPNKQRRSVSAEASKYIEALEAELATTQSQLSAVNSPSVTRQQKSAMRSLNAETRQLEAEIAEWEQRYDDRVREETDRFAEIEAGLRANIRTLEQQAEEEAYRLQELELEAESTKESLQAAEQANVQMERRLEIMGEMLATSPTKIDFATPAGAAGGVRKNRHQRPKSMLPRFPTASSLMGSPERVPRTQPTSPDMVFHGRHDAMEALVGGHDRDRQGLSIDTSLPISDMGSDVGSIFSEAPLTGDSMTTVGPDALSARRESFQSEHYPIQNGRRPTRRMRRFHGGSVGPKSLILPATSHYDNVPASAPPLEEAPMFPFPPPELLPPRHAEVYENTGFSPMIARRRASTEADENTLASLEVAPFLNVPSSGAVDDGSVGPNSAASQATAKDYSSLGSVVGRNLMEELTRARTDGTEDPWSTTGNLSSELDEAGSRKHQGSEGTTEASPDDTLLAPAFSPSAVFESHTQTHVNAGSTRHRLRLFFANLFRTPLALARHMVQNAQRWGTFSIPVPLRNVQWWLVGVLLGPMARRRMLLSRRERSARSQDEAAEEGRALLDSPCDGSYDTFSPASAAFSSPDPLAGPVTGVQRGRINQRSEPSPTEPRCGCGQKSKQVCRARHSPWLWLKFSLTLAFAVGAAFTQGPGSLLRCPEMIVDFGKEIQREGTQGKGDVV